MFRKILAATAALTLGLGGVLALAAPASATDTECVPKDGYTEYYVTDGEPSLSQDDASWVLESPGGDWYQVAKRTVVDKAAVAAMHYSLKGNSQNGQAEVPVTPSEDPTIWQANTKNGEPHYKGKGVPATDDDDTDYVKGESGLHYTSHGSSGLRDWFYFQPAVPEVSHTEYQFARDIAPVTCIPTKDDDVVVGEWVDGTYECDDTTVEQTREVTTTSYVWDAEMEDFFVKDITVVTETQTRDLTADEQTACPTDDPKDPPANDNPPQNQPPTELPGTGAGDVLPWAGLGIALLLSGLLAYMVTSRRRSSI
jgi:hypothetical protein